MQNRSVPSFFGAKTIGQGHSKIAALLAKPSLNISPSHPAFVKVSPTLSLVGLSDCRPFPPSIFLRGLWIISPKGFMAMPVEVYLSLFHKSQLIFSKGTLLHQHFSINCFHDRQTKQYLALFLAFSLFVEL